MDWSSIGSAAIYGAIGGGLGALIGGLLALPFQKTKIGKMAATALTVAGAVIGYNVAEPLLSPHIGEYIDDLTGANVVKPAAVTDRQVEQIMTGLRADPLVDALLDRDPALVDEAKEKLSQAYASGGLSELLKASSDLGYQIGQNQMLAYFVRAPDEDLVHAIGLVTDNIEYLVDTAPEVCYAWQFGSFGHAHLDFAALVRALGDEKYQSQQTALAAVVRNAGEVTPECDRDRAFEIVRKAGIEMLAVLGNEKMDLINGRLAPRSTEDKRLACKALSVMYRTMLNSNDPPSALRYTFDMSISG